MEMYSYSLNSSSTKNNTGVFCTDHPVGPLMYVIISVPSACVGIPASGWLLWLLIQMQRRGSSNNLYMLNLTTMDLLFNLCVIPSVINSYVHHGTMLEIISLLMIFCLCLRPLIMACICVDCYIAVIYPIWYMTIKNGRYRTVVCAVLWLLTLSVLMMLKGDEFFMSISILLSLSALAITFLNISTFCALRKPDPSGRDEVHPQKRRATQSIINSLVMALMTYPPLVIVCTVYILIDMSISDFGCTVMIPSLTIANAGSSVMPLLYLENLGKLKCIRLPC